MDRARTKVLEVLLSWEQRGSPMDPLFYRLVVADPLLADRDRAFVRELVYGVLRWRGRIDWIIAAYSRIKPQRMERSVLAILRMGVYQLLFMDRVPSHAAVDEAVALARERGASRAAPLINGILRGITEGRREVSFPDPVNDPLGHIASYYSHPPWMVHRWLHQWGAQETTSLCQANNQIPPLTLRVNTLKGDRGEVIRRLQDEGVEARLAPFSPMGIIVDTPPPFATWHSFQEGWLQVQDEASQLVPFILAPHPGQRVLDLCAAPGGKTTHLAQLMEDQGEIISVDISPAKLSLLQENCRRLGVSIVKTLAHDATVMLPVAPASFDQVLADVPCTGLGTLRRNPDGKWRVREADITRLQRLQREILAQAATLVKHGGILVYSTCTLTPEENEGVIGPFLSEHEDFSLESAAPGLPPDCEGLVEERGFLLTLPHRHGTDGFFAARIRRG